MDFGEFTFNFTNPKFDGVGFYDKIFGEPIKGVIIPKVKHENNVLKSNKGTYTVKFGGNTTTVTDEDGNVGVAKCAPEDEFKMAEGFEIAFMRCKAAKLEKEETKRKEEEAKKIHVGDTVEIVDNKKVFTAYTEWVYANVDDVSKCRYNYSFIPVEGLQATVKAIAPHGKCNEILAYIVSNNKGNGYVISLKGLKKVNTNG